MCRQCSGVTWMSHNANTLEMIVHFLEVLVAKIDDNVSASLETLNLIPIISEVSEMNAKKNAEKFMSSKEQKTPEGQAPEEIITEQHDDVEAVEPEVSAEQVDPRDEKIANLEAQLAEAQKREREVMLRAKADEDNLRRRTEQDIEKAHKFALEKFVNELLPVIDSLDRALEVADKANPDLAPMVEGIELTLKSMLDVVRKFGVEVIADTNVPLDPNVHQAIAMVESEDVAAGNVLAVMQKGYTLNGRTIRAAMVTVAKAK